MKISDAFLVLNKSNLSAWRQCGQFLFISVGLYFVVYEARHLWIGWLDADEIAEHKARRPPYEGLFSA